MSTRQNKKSIKVDSKNNKSSHAGVGASGRVTASPAPHEHAPDAPSGFDASQPHQRPPAVWMTLSGLAPSVAKEVSSPSFVEDFGLKQDPSLLADALAKGTAWREEKLRAETWLAYVRQGDASVWRIVLKELERFRKAFEYAVSCDASLAARYPHITEMFRARSAQGVRAANSRAKNKKKGAPANTGSSTLH
jgi:hypothetical protein